MVAGDAVSALTPVLMSVDTPVLVLVAVNTPVSVNRSDSAVEVAMAVHQ